MTPEELIMLELCVPNEGSVINETLTDDSSQAIPRPPICASTAANTSVAVLLHSQSQSPASASCASYGRHMTDTRVVPCQSRRPGDPSLLVDCDGDAGLLAINDDKCHYVTTAM